MLNKRKGGVNGIGWRAVSKNGCRCCERYGFHHEIVRSVIQIIPRQILQLEVFDGRHQASMVMVMAMRRMVDTSQGIPEEAR
jgi:hypothetical protein